MLSEARPPIAADGEDGDFFIEDRSAAGRGRWMYSPKANDVWPMPPWRIQACGAVTAVNDSDYQCFMDDVQVGVAALTALRTIYLPDVDTYPPGQDLVIADESGACSEMLTITNRPGAGTSDIIGSADNSAVILSNPYQVQGFRRGAANVWVRY